MLSANREIFKPSSLLFIPFISFFKKYSGTVVKNPPANAGDTGLTPGP